MFKKNLPVMIPLGYVSSIILWLAVVKITLLPDILSLIILFTPGKVPVCMRTKDNARLEDDFLYELCLYPFDPFLGNDNGMR
jgi:hypothetical protein